MIAPAQLDEIVTLVSARGTASAALEALRATLPALHFTFCMDDDVSGAEPVRTADGFKLYLVDGRNHCLTLTQQAEAATGVLIAEVDEA